MSIRFLEPIKNYLQDLMDNGFQIKGRNLEILNINATSSSDVDTGMSETVVITPPVGKIYRIIDVGIKILNTSGSAGDHYLSFVINATPQNINIAKISNVGTKDLTISYEAVDVVLVPSNYSDFLSRLQNIKISNETPLSLYYKNETGESQTSDREIVLLVESEGVIE